jgi:hypothetical protein
MRLAPMHYGRRPRVEQFEEDEWPRRPDRKWWITSHVRWIGTLAWPLRAVVIIGWLNVIAWSALAGLAIGIVLFGPLDV